MAIPSRQIGWSTKSNLLWQISKQLEKLTGVMGRNIPPSTTSTTTTTVPVDVTISLIAPNSQGVVELYVNGALAETQINLGSKTVTVNSNDTFYIIFDNSQEYDGIQWVLTNNAVFVDEYGDTTTQLISPTYTALPGGDYLFECNGYST